MYIAVFKNNGKDYLRLMESYRTKTDEGKIAIRKRIICNIGPLSKYDDGKPDYLERLRESFRLGNPLISELEEYSKRKNPLEKYTVCLQEGDPECVGHPLLYANVFLDKLFDELGLEDFFRSYKGFSKIQYDVLNFVRLLVYGRILNPDSKMATMEQNDDYYTPLLKNFNPYNVYDTLDFIYEHKEKIIRRMNTSLVKKWHRNPEIIFYDVTNFFFETDDPDEDILDEEGNVLEKGIRKMGVSKENRKQPIVQITNMQARMLRPFFKGDFINADTGEVIASSKLKALLDKEKLEEFKSHFGYYQIVTSEINMPVTEVIEKYHGLTRIEDQFRVMKSDLETRPVYVRTKEHIEAHLLICLIALTMIRMIQCKICRSGLVPKSDDITLWSMGLPAYRIQRALKKWNVELFADDLYRFTNLDDPDLKLIMDSFGIHIPAKLFNKTALKSQIKNINMEI